MDSRARRHLLEMIKSRGPTDASSLASELNITPMAVRQHMYALAEEGLVEAQSVKKGVGRPSKLWALTEAAHDFFPQGYAELTVSLMQTIRETFGEEGLDRIVETRGKQLAEVYGKELEDKHTLRDRAEALAAIRTREGYMSHIEEIDDGLLLIENHCPICTAAKSCTGLCASELDLFQKMMGKEVTVKRTDHILRGARRCAYELKPIS